MAPKAGDVLSKGSSVTAKNTPAPKSDTAHSAAAGAKTEKATPDGSKSSKPSDFTVNELKVVQHAMKSEHSKDIATLQKVKASLTLSNIRKRLQKKITDGNIFCDQYGSAELETTTLADYITICESNAERRAKKGGSKAPAEQKQSQQSKPSSFTLYVKGDEEKEQHATHKPDHGGTTASENQLGNNGGNAVDSGNQPTGTGTTKDPSNAGRDFQPDDSQAQGMVEGAKHASQLDAAEWQLVLENCGAMYGWFINRFTNQIEQAPLPAFQLRRVGKGTKTIGDVPSPQPGAEERTGKQQPNNKNRESTNEATPGQLEESEAQNQKRELLWEAAQTRLASSSEEAADADGVPEEITVEVEPDHKDPETSNSSTADIDVKTPESQTDNDHHTSEMPTEDLGGDEPSSSGVTRGLHDHPKSHEAEELDHDSRPPGTGSEKASSSDSSTENDTVAEIVRAKPRFHVSDNSKIEISMVSNEFQASLATNDFSSSHTEGSVEGGFGKFAASVSAGHSSSQSSSAGATINTFSKTMIAKYMLPRAVVYLEPSDLEPSDELVAAIARLKKSRSILDMRQLYKDFGQLFCKQITIGGRLLTSKIIEATEASAQRKEQQEYKTSVSASVSTPWVSGSVNHEHGGGSGTDASVSNAQKVERHAFEAVGGDTIKASNPTEWAPTCSLPLNWRVINRIGLSPMAEAISELPGYRSVQAIFAQALPALTRYIEMPKTREIKVRLRLESSTNGLSLANVNTSSKSYYLGHKSTSAITPKQWYIKDAVQAFWGGCVDAFDNIMFSPRTYRAPVIYGFAANKVSTSYFGRKNIDDTFATTWSMTCPYDDALTHQGRVILRSVTAKAGPPAASLVVFRNQQGVFLPAMGNMNDAHIFRVLKKGGRKRGETIQDGDDIRLSWNFQDQTIGFRDFTEDSFGRRRHAWPQELHQQTTLYLKLPWPRFEQIAPGTPNSLMMSFVESEEPTPVEFRTIPTERANGSGAKATYAVQDVSFRIDVVDKGGMGDIGDYMLASLAESNDVGEDLGDAEDKTNIVDDGQRYVSQIFLDYQS